MQPPYLGRSSHGQVADPSKHLSELEKFEDDQQAKEAQGSPPKNGKMMLNLNEQTNRYRWIV